MAGTSTASTSAASERPPNSNSTDPATGSSSSSSPGTDTSANTKHTSNTTNTTPAVSAHEQEQLTKLGVLLVNVGAASEEKVFGVKGSRAMQSYQNHAMTDLLVINRHEDDAAAHPFLWYKPWTWWRSGPQVSPIVRVPALTPPVYSHGSAASLDSSHAVPTSDGTTQTDLGEDEALPPPPPAAATPPAVKAKRKKGLPTVDMRPLTDDEVAALTPAVQEDRAKVMKAEEHIHAALQNIEDTRYRYLVPARDLHCEAEVVAVVRCYAERHQAAASRHAAAAASSSAADNAAAAKTTSAAAAAAPVVRADLLACGPDVRQLKACAEKMAMAYSHEGEVA